MHDAPGLPRNRWAESPTTARRARVGARRRGRLPPDARRRLLPGDAQPNWTVGGDRWSRPVPTERPPRLGVRPDRRQRTEPGGERRVRRNPLGVHHRRRRRRGCRARTATSSRSAEAATTSTPSTSPAATSAGRTAGGNGKCGGGAMGTARPDGRAILVAVSHSDQPDPDPGDREAYTHRLLALEAADGACAGNVRYRRRGVRRAGRPRSTVVGGHESRRRPRRRAFDSGGGGGAPAAPGRCGPARDDGPRLRLRRGHRGCRHSVRPGQRRAALAAFARRGRRRRRGWLGPVRGNRSGRVRSLRATDGGHSGRSPGTPVGESASTRHRGRLRPLRRRVAPGGGRQARRHAVLRDRGRGSTCGLEPGWANGLLYDGFDATVSGRWSLGNFDADAE